ncbi:hypothetical protein C4K30_5191 [Pseudomonas chlororaphis subsp. piscium]|nr:hypothetical protein C4K30_5191 [Pseudomonas chlororaphis subsp. piscium]
MTFRASERSAALVSSEGAAPKWGQGSANPLMDSTCSRTFRGHALRDCQGWNTKKEQPEHRLRETRWVFHECCSGWVWITAYGDDMRMTWAAKICSAVIPDALSLTVRLLMYLGPVGACKGAYRSCSELCQPNAFRVACSCAATFASSCAVLSSRRSASRRRAARSWSLWRSVKSRLVSAITSSSFSTSIVNALTSVATPRFPRAACVTSSDASLSAFSARFSAASSPSLNVLACAAARDADAAQCQPIRVIVHRKQASLLQNPGAQGAAALFCRRKKRP